MHVLRLLHASLAQHGLLLDTQPVGAEPAVSGSGRRLGCLDLRRWVEMVASVDAQVEVALAAGLFRLEQEENFLVHDEFDEPRELLETVSSWRGTVVPEGLAQRVRAASPPFLVEQQVRMRLFRRQ